MVVVSVLFAVAAATAAIVLAVRVRNQGRALGAAAERAAALETELDRARGERASQTVRADTAEAERAEAAAQARASAAELQVAVASLADATRTRDSLAGELETLRAQHAGCADVTALWALELARIERRWQLSVAPGIGLTSPLATCAEHERPRVAIEILGEALREETGTRVELAWHVATALTPVDGLHVVRIADELLAANALHAERLALTVTDERDEQADADDAHGVTLAVSAFDHDDTPVAPAPWSMPAPDTAAPAGVVSIDEGRVRLHLGPAESGVAA